MSEQHLLQMIGTTYAKLSHDERVKKIRELTRKDPTNKDFIKKFFPEMYKETYPNG